MLVLLAARELSWAYARDLLLIKVLFIELLLLEELVGSGQFFPKLLLRCVLPLVVFALLHELRHERTHAVKLRKKLLILLS